MATEQRNITEVMVQVVDEEVRVAVHAMAVVGGETPQDMKEHIMWGPKLMDPKMKQPTFNWKPEDKYKALINFRLEVNNVFKSYKTPQTAR